MVWHLLNRQLVRFLAPRSPHSIAAACTHQKPIRQLRPGAAEQAGRTGALIGLVNRPHRIGV